MGKKILIVDDDPANLKIVKHMIELLIPGQEAVAVNDPLTALKLVTIECLEPDLVITDLQMPGLQGDELAVKLRDHGFKKPIILMSGKFFDGTEKLADINAVVKKPYDIYEFADVIRLHLGL